MTIKYLKIDIINKIKQFVMFYDRLYFINENELLFENNKQLFNVYGLEANKYGVFAFTNMSNVSTSIILESEVVQTSLSLNSMAFNGVDTIVRKKDNGIKRNGMYNIINNEIKWLDNLDVFGQCLRSINYLFHRKGHYSIKSLSLLTGEYNWSLDLSGRYYQKGNETKETAIKEIIGLWEDVLLVSLTSYELVAIDTNSGQVIWETNDLYARLSDVFQPHKHYDFTRNLFIEDGYLYELSSCIYYRIHIKTQKLEILWKDDREEDFITIRYTSNCIDYIYFVAAHQKQLQCEIVGVFNRKTFSIDWQENINLSVDPALGYQASINQKPQATADKIYVLDTGGALHIYQKDV
jgi:outer membrane protein assembly factor BamB